MGFDLADSGEVGDARIGMAYLILRCLIVVGGNVGLRTSRCLAISRIRDP